MNVSELCSALLVLLHDIVLIRSWSLQPEGPWLQDQIAAAMQLLHHSRYVILKPLAAYAMLLWHSNYCDGLITELCLADG